MANTDLLHFPESTTLDLDTHTTVWRCACGVTGEGKREWDEHERSA